MKGGGNQHPPRLLKLFAMLQVTLEEKTNNNQIDLGDALKYIEDNEHDFPLFVAVDTLDRMYKLYDSPKDKIVWLNNDGDIMDLGWESRQHAIESMIGASYEVFVVSFVEYLEMASNLNKVISKFHKR